VNVSNAHLYCVFAVFLNPPQYNPNKFPFSSIIIEPLAPPPNLYNGPLSGKLYIGVTYAFEIEKISSLVSME
jgi:hypothetical protein